MHQSADAIADQYDHLQWAAAHPPLHREALPRRVILRAGDATINKAPNPLTSGRPSIMSRETAVVSGKSRRRRSAKRGATGVINGQSRPVRLGRNGYTLRIWRRMDGRTGAVVLPTLGVCSLIDWSGLRPRAISHRQGCTMQASRSRH
jgi:hypothetical protein